MISLFKKKSETAKQESMPPLPDDLPDENNGAISTMNSSSLPPVADTSDIENHTHDDNSGSVHDLIPNDVSLNIPKVDSQQESETPLSDKQPNSPLLNNEPELEDPSVPKLPPLDGINKIEESSLPPMPDIKTNEPNLPDIPSLEPEEDNAEISTSNPDVNKNKVSGNGIEQPQPNVDDDIPEPPAIFSEDGFYETPDEVKHLVKETSNNLTDYNTELKTTELNTGSRIEVPRETIDMKNEEVPGYNEEINSEISRDSLMNEINSKHNNGPIFVDMDSFKAMTDGIDTIKQDIKSSEQILTHLNQIKDSKDKELERWRLQLEDIQRKISYVDKVIFNEA